MIIFSLNIIACNNNNVNHNNNNNNKTEYYNCLRN